MDICQDDLRARSYLVCYDTKCSYQVTLLYVAHNKFTPRIPAFTILLSIHFPNCINDSVTSFPKYHTLRRNQHLEHSSLQHPDRSASAPQPNRQVFPYGSSVFFILISHFISNVISLPISSTRVFLNSEGPSHRIHPLTHACGDPNASTLAFAGFGA